MPRLRVGVGDTLKALLVEFLMSHHMSKPSQHQGGEISFNSKVRRTLAGSILRPRPWLLKGKDFGYSQMRFLEKGFQDMHLFVNEMYCFIFNMPFGIHGIAWLDRILIF